MAINPAGSRPIVVRGMSFRWRQNGAEPQFVVWHTLDEGTLTVRLPDYEPVQSPRAVAQVVERGLDEGWRTYDHLRLELTTEEWQAYRRERTWPTPDPEAPVDRGLQLPVLEEVDGSLLQVVYRPAAAAPFGLTLTLGSTAQVGLDTSEGGERRVREGVELEAVQDVLVATRSARVRRAEPGNPLCSGRVALRDARGAWEMSTDLGRANGRARVAAVGAWRLACEAFSDEPWVMDLLQSAHGYLLPDEHPLTVDEVRRRIRVFGRWRADALALALEEWTGPWVVDARRLLELSGDSRGLRRVLRRRRTSFVWIGEPHRLRSEVYLGLRVADDDAGAQRLLEDGAHELLEEALLRTIHPRWVVHAGEWLTHRDPAHRLEAYDQIDQWLGPSWKSWTGDDVAGWRFTGGFEGWKSGLPAAGLVLSPKRLWAVAGDGRVFTTTG